MSGLRKELPKSHRRQRHQAQHASGAVESQSSAGGPQCVHAPYTSHPNRWNGKYWLSETNLPHIWVYRLDTGASGQ